MYFFRYIGSTGVDGLHHLVWEVLDNCVDEALSGYASLITVTLNADKSCTITDDGRGIPCDMHPTTGKSALETVLTVLHAGGKFENDGYKVSGGLHGVGISVVNALSESTKVRVWRKSSIPINGDDGVGENVKRHEMEFLRGKPVDDLKIFQDVSPAKDIDFGLTSDGEASDKNVIDIDADDKSSSSKKKMEQMKRAELETMVADLHAKRTTGTEVTFLPDIQVFKGENGKPGIEFDIERLKTRMDEIAYLNAGLTLTLCDKRFPAIPVSVTKKAKAPASSNCQIFYHAGGLCEYMDVLCQTKTPLFGINAPKSKSSTTAKKKTATRTKKPKALPETHPLQSLLSPDHSTILCQGTTDTPNGPVSASIAIRYSADQYTETIYSFVNNIRTRDGGTHVEGLKACLTRTVNSCAKKLNKLKGDGSNLPGEFVREGLTAILSVQVPDPEFEGQTKGRLGNPGKIDYTETTFSCSRRNIP